MNEIILTVIEVASVAEWMLKEIESKGYLYQEDASHRIAKQFGKQCCYYTVSGNLAINKRILSKFRLLSKNKARWFLGNKSWRKPIGNSCNNDEL